jgi:hypothetical protein
MGMTKPKCGDAESGLMTSVESEIVTRVSNEKFENPCTNQTFNDYPGDH